MCVCDPIVSAMWSEHERRTQEGEEIEHRRLLRVDHDVLRPPPLPSITGLIIYARSLNQSARASGKPS